MIESEYSPYSEDEFEGDSEDEGVERSPKDDHHSSGHHSLSRSPDANSANSLTANPSTPSTTGNARRVRMKRTTSNKAGKTRQAVSKVVKRPVTPVAVSAVKQRVSQIQVVSTQNRNSAKTTRTTPKQRTGTIISMAAPSPLERVVLAKQEKITALSNQLTMKDREIEELKRENKLLKTVQYRQEKALDRFQNAEADLPQLVNRHAVEMMSLKQRLKKSQDGLQVAEHKLREQNEEMWKLKVMLNEVTKLSGDKHLLERDRLRQMLNKANEKLEEKTKRASELEKHVELQSKSYVRELKEFKAKFKQAAQDAEKWQEQYETVSLQLREKNKELEIKNIYSQRIVKNIPRILPSVMLTSTQDAAVNTDPIAISDIRSAMDMASRTPISLVESMVIGLREDNSPSPTHPIPRPPSHPRPHNLPRRTSPLTSSHVLSSSVVRDGATWNADVTVKRDANNLELEEHRLHSKSPPYDSNMSSQVDMEEQQWTFEGRQAIPIDTFVTQSSKAEAGVGPELTTHDEEVREATSLTMQHMTAQQEQRKKDEAQEEQRKKDAEERRKKDLLLAKLRAIDDGQPTDSATELTIASETRNQPKPAARSSAINEGRPTDSVTELTVSTEVRDQPKPADSSSDEQTTNGAFVDIEIQGNSWPDGQLLFSGDVVRDGQTSDKEQQHKNPSDTASVVSKTSSHQTWNRRVENMHSGRPALSTDENYYGRQSAGMRATEQQNAAETNHKQVTEYAPSLGSHSSSKGSDSSKDHREHSGNSVNRRHKPPLTGSITKLDANGEIPTARKTHSDDVGETFGYQPSLGVQKKAVGPGVLDKKLPVKFSKKKAYPWETNVPVFRQKKMSGDQLEADKSTNSFDMLSSEPLLKRSERQELGNLLGNIEWNGQLENMNDDDIEEVVI